jgi:hypothetical protein
MIFSTGKIIFSSSSILAFIVEPGKFWGDVSQLCGIGAFTQRHNKKLRASFVEAFGCREQPMVEPSFPAHN